MKYLGNNTSVGMALGIFAGAIFGSCRKVTDSIWITGLIIGFTFGISFLFKKIIFKSTNS